MQIKECIVGPFGYSCINKKINILNFKKYIISYLFGRTLEIFLNNILKNNILKNNILKNNILKNNILQLTELDYLKISLT